MHRLVWIAVSCLMIASCLPTEGPPETRTATTVDAYHGVEVEDEYRWLENWSDPVVQNWSHAQDAHARRLLNSLPQAKQIRDRVADILRASSTVYSTPVWTGQVYLAEKTQPPLQQPLLVALESADAPETEFVVLDPNQLDRSGATSIDWYVPSPDGRLVAVSLSRGGSELGDLDLYEIRTGDRVGETIPGVNAGTAGGDLAWALDSSGFYYTRYPRPGERPQEDLSFYQEIWFHDLSSPVSDDRYEFGRGFPKTAEFRLATDRSSGRILATYQHGDSGRFQLHIRHQTGTWMQLAREEDEVVQCSFGPGGSLFLISRLGAPRGRLLQLPPDAASVADARVVVEEAEDTIVSSFSGMLPTMAVTADGVYLTYQLGGPTTIRSFDLAGEPRPGPGVPPIAAVRSISPGPGDELLFSSVSYLEPVTWYRFDRATGTTTRTRISSEPTVDFSDTEVVREFAASKDGTRVPINIIRPRGVTLDGDRPTLVTGYGGFGISRTPRFRPLWRIWLDHGGVMADANIRGGGEFGEDWHHAGMLTRKQNCFDDFAAAMQFMIDRGYTRPERLAIIGGSNGGLLMGAMITQHPGLCRAVVSQVGIYDMLRVELSSNGAFNIPEYGSVQDPEQFRALHAYSPFHRVVDGTPYPAVLMTTGANDPRVDPMQSRKMTARLQAATRSKRPILLRTSMTTGHGGAVPLDEKIDEQTHVYAFLLSQIGAAENP